MAVFHITKDNISQELLETKTVLLDFWAPWCGPCRMASPLIDEIAREIPNVKVCKINVDEEPELAQEFGVMSIPMFVVIKDGVVTHQEVGLRSKDDILSWVS